MALLLSGAAASAATTVEGFVSSSDGKQDRIQLRWSEAGSVEVSKFENARQVLVVLDGASLGRDVAPRPDVSALPSLERVRLQEVTLPNGRKGVQATLQLSEWADIQPMPSAEGLTILLPVPASAQRAAQARTADAPATPGRQLELTDELIARMERGEHMGSPDAPATGAGQAPVNKNDVSKYFVPEAGTRTRTTDSGGDMAEMAVMSKLNEKVRRVDFKATALENVLRLVAEQSELNILIKAEDMRGKVVTLRLRDVSLGNILDALLKHNNLGYTIEPGGIVRIVSRDQVKSTVKETITETVSINWVDAAEVATILKPFLDNEDGKAEVAKSSNQIIIRDVPENVQKVQQLIQQIDIPEKQVMVEMRLVNMSETATREMGVRTNFNQSDTVTRATPDADGSVATRTLTGSSSSGSNSNGTVTESVSRNLGSGVTSTTSSTSTAGNTASSSTGETFTSSAADFFRTTGGAGLIGLGDDQAALTFQQLGNLQFLGQDYDISFKINALETRGEVTTLANPMILSLNNTKAKVEIKRQIPYISAINTDTGSVGTVEFKDVGTTVEVTPRITNNGYVIMNIKPEQKLLSSETPANEAPPTDERNIEASVVVKDEQTIVLGGLREFTSRSDESGVPYLLRVPVISWLFKNQRNRQDKTELYLFVTPHIVKDPTPTTYQAALYDKIDYNWDLPDYYFDEVYARSSPNELNDPNLKR